MENFRQPVRVSIHSAGWGLAGHNTTHLELLVIALHLLRRLVANAGGRARKPAGCRKRAFQLDVAGRVLQSACCAM